MIRARTHSHRATFTTVIACVIYSIYGLSLKIGIQEWDTIQQNGIFISIVYYG